jgi:hypothetical protein
MMRNIHLSRVDGPPIPPAAGIGMFDVSNWAYCGIAVGDSDLSCDYRDLEALRVKLYEDE